MQQLVEQLGVANRYEQELLGWLPSHLAWIAREEAAKPNGIESEKEVRP